MKSRICVTGYGLVSALGRGKAQTLSALMEERSGIEPVRYLDTLHRGLPVGEVKMDNATLSALTGAGGASSQLRTVLLGLLAGRDALEDAGLQDLKSTAFINGTTVGGMDLTEQAFKEVLKQEEGLWSEYNTCGKATEMIASSLGRFQMVTTASTACSSAANAIMMGCRLIESGLVTSALAGGTESLTRFHLNGFNTLMILDSERCRPFDADRHGINLGEGAAYLVLESEETAIARGRKPLAYVSGYGNACDAFHQTASSAEGEGAFQAMRKALRMSGLQPSDIDYVNAHGTGTPNNDQSEIAAMKRIWGESLPPFSSTKAFTGHTTSASGSLKAAFCLLALSEGFLPANLGLNEPLSEGLNIVRGTRRAQLRHVLTNSFGFGGNDTSLILSRP